MTKAQELLAAKARRVRLARQRVVAATLAAFVLAWGVVAFDGSMGARRRRDRRVHERHDHHRRRHATFSDDSTSSDDALVVDDDSAAALTTSQS